ncbi:MAG TPA: iron ABC transporter permease [Polyangia bacterium]|jgi:iron complex transport system permease protein|nr:iron ABC transporter permease [Polyangia bacterium]
MLRNRRSRVRALAAVLVCAALVCVAVALGTFLGSARIPPGDVLAALLRRSGGWQETVVWSIRLPRALLGLMVGGGLALAGATLQGLFRNPLADPGILGVSSGASLGAVLVITLGLSAHAVWLLPVAAFAGAVLTALLVFVIAARRGRGRIFTGTLLLVGIAVSALNVSLVTFVLSLSLDNYEVGRQVMYWLLGGLEGRTWDHVLLGAPAVVVGAAVVIAHARSLDALLLGEIGAQSVGVDLPRVRLILTVATSLIVGASVAVAGPVGFVGLLIPHIVRLAVGPGHRVLMPLSFFLGGVFVSFADLVARTVLAPGEIPVGVVTAAVGAPIFLALLVRRGGEVAAS